MSCGTHPTTPWLRWFAWHPVDTVTHGWRWLCWIERQRIMCNSNGPVELIGWSFWQYRKVESPPQVSAPNGRQRIEPHPGGWRRIHPYDGWRARVVEAWWTMTGRFTLHRAWQNGYDQHIQDESARRSRGGK